MKTGYHWINKRTTTICTKDTFSSPKTDAGFLIMRLEGSLLLSGKANDWFKLVLFSIRSIESNNQQKASSISSEKEQSMRIMLDCIFICGQVIFIYCLSGKFKFIQDNF